MKTSSVSIAKRSLRVTTILRRRRCVTSTSLAITSFGCLTRRLQDVRVKTSETGSSGADNSPETKREIARTRGSLLGSDFLIARPVRRLLPPRGRASKRVAAVTQNGTPLAGGHRPQRGRQGFRLARGKNKKPRRGGASIQGTISQRHRRDALTPPFYVELRPHPLPPPRRSGVPLRNKRHRVPSEQF